MTDERPRVGRRVASARLRILAWLVLLLVLAGAGALVLQRRLLVQQHDDEVALGLRQEVEELRALAAGRDPSTGRPFEGDIAAIFETFLRRNLPHEGEVLLTFIDDAVFSTTPAPGDYRLDRDPNFERLSTITRTHRGDARTPEGPVRYLAVPLADDGGPRGVFVVVNFLRAERQEIDRATQIGALVYGSVLVIAIGLAWLIAGRVLAPVRAITAAAREVTETDLGRRIPVPASRDEIAELARTFNAMIARLDGAFRQQREFLDDAGHELRTPITIVRGHLELEGEDPAERDATRALMLDELDRMARIVDDLLVLARAEQPDFLQREDVDLDLLTGELLSKATALGDREWRLAATGHGIVVADRQRITQAVMNLLDNAVRHTQPGEAVELGSEIKDGAAHLWVRDHGPGVAPHDQERIFERFTHGRHNHRHAGSAGLGLAIVRAIAEAHGGRVKLDDTPGGGATFRMTIPAEP
jgi:two-component system, OmpR family, sensor kinase